MTISSKKKLLLVVRCTPYGSSLARSSLDIALSSSSFGQSIAVLFMGEGVLQLLPEQDSSPLGARNIAKLIASFPLYDLTQLYVDSTGLTRYGVSGEELPAQTETLDADAMRQLMCRYDHILGL